MVVVVYLPTSFTMKVGLHSLSLNVEDVYLSASTEASKIFVICKTDVTEVSKIFILCKTDGAFFTLQLLCCHYVVKFVFLPFFSQRFSMHVKIVSLGLILTIRQNLFTRTDSSIEKHMFNVGLLSADADLWDVLNV
jgi:hypothetical protein